MGGAVSAGENNDDLIDNLLEADYIKTPSVERVFRAVDRAHYFTPEFQDNAYKDLAWKWGNLHLSAPCIYSEVMESLAVSSGLSFLNLGSGTGYLSTMVGLILGPYGINHGIELHEDAVNYANKKLDEFKSKSTAMDEYEFCEPKFIQGNCLKLGSDVRQYDRVYCGAACPDYHENYMKNLIKIGGILVMPLNDQLLQITRTDETTWAVKSVLPVSFAPLILPEPNGPAVSLPDNEPLSLLELCRSTIRCILRRNVEVEHPGVNTRRQCQPKKKYKKKILRRLVIPIFEESDDEDFAAIIEDESDERDFERASLIYDVHRHRAGQFTAVIELARNLAANRTGTRQSSESTSEEGKESSSNESGEEASVPSSNEATETRDLSSYEMLNDTQKWEPIELEMGDEDKLKQKCEKPVNEKNVNVSAKKVANKVTAPGGTAESSVSATVSNYRTILSEQRKKIPKRKKSDSGIGDEMENGKCISSDSDHEEERTFMEIDSDSDFSDALPAVKRTYQVYSSGPKSSQGEDSTNANNDDGVSRRPCQAGAPRSDTVIWKRLAFATEVEEEESTEGAAAAAAPSDAPTVALDTYSVHMRVKIQLLPLPPALKSFLNLNREF